MSDLIRSWEPGGWPDAVRTVLGQTLRPAGLGRWHAGSLQAPANDVGASTARPAPIRILLVDDDLVDRLTLRRALGETGLHCEFAEAGSGREALAQLKQGSFDCVLVDYHLPDIAGIDLIAAAKTGAGPVFIVITGSGSERVAVEAMRRGAGDYLSKDDLDPRALHRSISVALNLGAARKAYRQAQAQLQHLALHDPLTSLPNRVLFEHLLDKAMRQAKGSGQLLAVAQLDLDGFKLINDTYGHPAGDHVLHETARRMRACLRGQDTAARLGGDEFAVIITQIAGAGELTPVFDRIRRAIAQPIAFSGATVMASASIGVSLYPNDALEPGRLLSNADVALYRAKSQRPGGIAFFARSMRTALDERRVLERDLHRAMAKDELTVYYQPQIRLGDRSLFGFEALIRWQHPSLGLLAPDRFLEIAEHSGLILPIGKALIEQVCRQIAAWRAQGLPEVRVALNISPVQLRGDDLVGAIEAASAAAGIKPDCLTIELREGVLLDAGREQVSQTLSALQELGVLIAVDDFGAGDAALGHLRNFPLDCLKIDRGFVADLEGDQATRAIVGTMVSLSRRLDKLCIAAGVETPAQRRWLEELGATVAQGYLFARPLPPEAASGYLERAGQGLPAIAERAWPPEPPPLCPTGGDLEQPQPAS